MEETAPILLERLHDGRIDLALLALPVLAEELICEDLFREPFFVVVPPKHRLASRKMIELQEIRTDPLSVVSQRYVNRINWLSKTG